MKLHYVSFFYFNIVLLFFFILKIDLIVLIFLFFRKEYAMYKESYLEFIAQDFDSLEIESQVLDFHENKLFLDFGMDIILEEEFLYEIYMDYAFFDFSMDFESFTGEHTFQWSDFNLKKLNYKKNCLKKVYLKDANKINFFFWEKLKQKNIDTSIRDDDYTYIYNYKSIIRRDIEDLSLGEDYDKFYYSYLKKFFLKENFYDIFMEDYYDKLLNYNNFIYKLKEKRKKDKLNKINHKINLNNEFKIGVNLLDYNDNLLDIRKDLASKDFSEKEDQDQEQ